MITIIDYGLGNLGSVANMLRRIGVRSRISADPAVVGSASALILPGVGHFDEGMAQLHDRGLVPVLNECVRERKVPLLGICLGAQLLARRSDEGQRPGLGWVAADVVKFDFGTRPALPVPHMGWNDVELSDPEMFTGLSADARFYFVHSFHFRVDAPAHAVAWCTYGFRFVAAVRSGHVWGCQFHPEKSHRFGMKVLENWVQFTQGVARAA
jgi:imidazole glycerol-phosphate synthase subunit HisH